LVAKRTLKFEIEWIKAHADHTWNEYADKLANNAARKQPLSSASAQPTQPTSSNSHSHSASHGESQSNTSKLYLKCSFNEKDQVKQMGARWDPDKKSWWVKDDASGQSRKQFAKWL